MRGSRAVIAFVNVAHVLDHMLMLVFPTAVLAMGIDLGRPYAELLPLSLGGFVAFGAGSLPAGWLGDRWSRRHLLAVFFLGIGAATALTGLSRSPAELAIGLTAIGVFASIYHPVGTAMLTAHAEQVGRAIGVNGVWGNLGVAFATLAAGALTQWLGWRWAFVVPGCLALAAGGLYLALVPPGDAPPRPRAGHAGPLPRAVVIRAFAVLAAVTAAGGVVFNATTVSLPKVFEERIALLAGSPFGVGALAAAVYVVGATSQLVVGRLVDRHPLRTVFVPLAALQAPLLFVAAGARDWAMVALAVGVMFAVFGQVTVNDTMVARYTDPAWRARVYALRYLVSFGASAAAVPLVAWLHARAGGFALTFRVLAAFGLAVLLGALCFPHRPDEVAPRLAEPTRTPA